MSRSAFALPNIRWFLVFRVFFNARFYYPVFMLVFLDYGLTKEQFFLLNGVWAAAWFLFEVPSGAMADIVGRRNLLVLTGVIMILEMAVIAFVPLGSVTLLFSVFLLNRILSGLGEAAASGADEALAYDSLASEGLEDQWPRVLEWVMRLQAIAFAIVPIIGSLVYDAEVLNRVLGWLGFEANLSQTTTMRLPILLCLFTGAITLWAAWRMREPARHVERDPSAPEPGPSNHPVRDAFAVTLRAGKWILMTPLALVVIAGGLLYDSVIRVFLTSTSLYYQIIEIPEAWYGVLMASGAALGIVTSRLARILAEKRTPLFNALFGAGLVLLGLVFLAQAIPYWGLLAAIPLFVSMTILGFLMSFYLNRIASSSQRATVLSFKGLAFNLGYGAMGLFFAGIMALERDFLTPEMSGQALEDAVFVHALGWLPWIFAASFVLFLLFAGWKLGWKRPAAQLQGKPVTA